MHDDDLIDPTVDRVWAVDVTVTYTTYVVAQNAEEAEEAERVAEDEATEDDVDCSASELTEPLKPGDGGDATLIPYGASRWDGRQITVNEALELVASRKPVYDTQTVLMPFADSPPPIHPRPDQDAAGRQG